MPRADPVLERAFALLAASVRPPDEVSAASAVQDAAAQDPDWPLLLQLAARHRVLPGLATGLARAGIMPPAPEAEILRRAAFRATHDEMMLAATGRRLLDLFSRAGIPVAIIKGPPLSMAIHGRLGLRTSRDLDLLVTPEYVPAALEAIGDAGLIPTHPAQLAGIRGWMRSHKDIELADPATKLVVELHWRLFDNPHIMADAVSQPWSAGMLDPETRCSVLPDRTNLLYLCNHGAQHAWSRLKWLADVAALLFRIGPDGREQLYAGAAPAEGRRAVGQTLLLCALVFDMPASPSVQRDLARDRRLGWLVRLARRSLLDGGTTELEARWLGSTMKNVSHYLISGAADYWLSEAWFDLNDLSTTPAQSGWRRLGPVGRIGSWIGRAINHS